MTPYLYWIGAEAALSILAVCLPAIFQLSRHGHQFGPRALFHSRQWRAQRDIRRAGRHGSSRGKRNFANVKGFQRLWHGQEEWARSQDKHAGGVYEAGVVSAITETDDLMAVPMERIMVTQNIQVSYV